jgi:WD40 repeat protein
MDDGTDFAGCIASSALNGEEDFMLPHAHSGAVLLAAAFVSSPLMADSATAAESPPKAGGDKTARLWDPATGAELRRFQGHQNWVAGVAFSPDGKQLATASADKTVKVWDVEVVSPFTSPANPPSVLPPRWDVV